MTSSRQFSTPAEELYSLKEKDFLEEKEPVKVSTGILSAEEFADVVAVYRLLGKWRDEEKISKHEAVLERSLEGP